MPLNKTQKRKLSIFARCLIFSGIAWVMFATANHYTDARRMELRYVKMPEDKAFHPLQSDTATVYVEMTGWQYLMSSFRKQAPQLEVDLTNLGKRNWIALSDQYEFMSGQFPANHRIVSVAPDTLYFDFSNQTERKVAVVPSYDLQFRKQYGIIDEVSVSPQYVTITGPLEDVVKIDGWETDTIRASGVDRTLSANVSLNNHQRANINVYPTTVDVTIPVGEMTEKVIEVPIRAENAQEFSSVKLLPGKVKLTIMVSLRDYARVSVGSFEAVVNMEDWVDKDIRHLPVLITQKPDYCKLIKIEPQNVDFFVRK